MQTDTLTFPILVPSLTPRPRIPSLLKDLKARKASSERETRHFEKRLRKLRRERDANPFAGVAPFNLTIAMTELLALGLELDEVVATVCGNPARMQLRR